ncbi:MAG: chloride channel protein, partial [Aureliella sp.]
VSAVLLAIELLLFEFRPRSIIPVALAASAATAIRMMFEGMEPVFAMANLQQPTGPALATYIALGGFMGLVSVLVTKAVYAVEDAFERLPIHWMWWPALGAIVVGLVGVFAPDTLGVGYYNIEHILSAKMTVGAIAFLCAMKFLSWSVSLGSGTSGGTLAPLFTIGGGVGAVIGMGLAQWIPALGVDPRIAGLVGMAAIFAGASRAMLASAVFAFETTLQPFGLLPLLGGCAAAYLISSLLMRNSIMTEKIARRGIITPEEYVADVLNHVRVSDVGSANVISVQAEQTVAEVQTWLSNGSTRPTHQGFPVLDASGVLVGLVTRRNIGEAAVDPQQKVAEIMRQPVRYVFDDCTVRQAADHMVSHGIGRLPIVSRQRPHRLVGIITRSDVLSVFQKGLKEVQLQRPTVKLPMSGGRKTG